MASFDPEASLPDAPDPWAGSEIPAIRDGPPYAMTEMIAAEPALAERLVRRLARDPAVLRLAQEIRAAAADRRPILTTGCGTSEHAAIIAADLLTDALDGATVWSMQALEVARRPPPSGVVVAISHEGGTWATNEALKSAMQAGATAALITVSDRSPGAALADVVLTTGEQDQSWCHTVGYLSPVITAAALAAELRSGPLDAVSVRALLAAANGESNVEEAAAALARCSRLLTVGSGIDYPAARELALKIEEGARMPASALPLETIRHGHLAAADERTGLILVLTDAESWGETLLHRARAVLSSAEKLGMPAAALLAADLGDDIPLGRTPAGRLSVPLAGGLPRTVAAALATAIPLQLLAERLARARGTNPDTIGRDDPRQAAAADA
ncbi:MAG: SIS domain-containing protein [Chloroflexota bacterium]|nr:SIS domain-containing protein [Chloroflexota bacterium]